VQSRPGDAEGGPSRAGTGLENLAGPIKIDIVMAHQTTESKRLLLHYRAMGGGNGSTAAFAGRSLSLPATGTFLRNFGRQQNQIS
jgi:hypothetical protein